MAAPASLTPSPVVGLGSFSYSLFEDDFAINKNVLKAKATTALSGVVNYKFQQDSKGNSQEVKVQFPYKRYYVWTGFRKDTTKVHVDFGEFNFGKKFRLYANNKFPQQNFKFGAVQESPKCTSHTRVEYNQSPQEWLLTSRAHSRFNSFHLVFAGTFNLTQKRPARYDLLFGYNQPQYDLFLRHYSTSNNSFRLGRLVADFVYKRNQTENYGVEVEYNADKKNLTTNVAASKNVNGYLLKARVNPETYSTFLSVKGKVDSRFAVTLSAQSPHGQGVKNEGVLPFPFSVTLETTV